MKRISSPSTWFCKRVFPACWFGLLAVLVMCDLSYGIPAQRVWPLVGLAAMAVFSYFLVKKLTWELVDEVYDCGDLLLVRNRGKEDRVLLSNIVNVDLSMFVRPRRLTLRLETASMFGDEIAFTPITASKLNPFAVNRIAEDLIMRVDEARSGRAV